MDWVSKLELQLGNLGTMVSGGRYKIGCFKGEDDFKSVYTKDVYEIERIIQSMIQEFSDV